MARGIFLALLSLLLFTVSCTQSSFFLRSGDTSHPEKPSQIPEPTSEEKSDPSNAAPSDATIEEGNVLALSPALEESSANGESQAELDSEEEPYTDQKRVDDALYYYQEALEYRNSGDPDRAIQSLDQSYQIIFSIQNEDDPEITQQKEDLRLLISKRILEIYASRSHPQMGPSREMPLAMNQYVTREIKRFQTTERSFFIQSYRLSGRYRPYIVEQMRKAGTPEDLSWLPLIESGFKTRALSKARALGLWQFIASTAYRYDLRRDRWVDERMDPERSTQAAIAYLKVLHGLFGDWTTALAAYNCGEGNVLRVIRQQHVNYLDDFWDLYPRLPLETARYVPRFLAALHIIKDPEKYGFYDLELDQPLISEQVQVNRQMRLKDIARVLNVPAKTLEELNSSLRYKVTPNYPFTLKLPADTSTTFVAKLEEIPGWKPPKRAYVIHRVRFGETLSEIALKYRVSVRRIVHANHLRSASRIRAGQRLKIPLRGHIVTAKSTSSHRVGSTEHYQVKRGDSLWLIARRFNTTVTEIKTLNGMHSDLLHTGQVILVQGGSR
ncbi:MAG: LysM peptidoglycan-binding domain-containing protein [Deltaproteobacteria bacterium]|nr:MAG: LysM peptidoglycan-binding domain-containing protein [Deltaproteobacteria bacterium]